jgi:hypothetical protein
MFHDESFGREVRRFTQNGSTASSAGSAWQVRGIGPGNAASVGLDSGGAVAEE